MKFTYNAEVSQVLRYALVMASKLDLQPHNRPQDYWRVLAMAALDWPTVKPRVIKIFGRLQKLQQRSLEFAPEVQRKIQYSDVWQGTSPVYLEQHAADILNQTVWQTGHKLTLACVWFLLLHHQPQYFPGELWLPQTALDVIQTWAVAGPGLSLPGLGPDPSLYVAPPVAPVRYRRHLY